MKMEYSRHESGRLFENGFLEAISKVHPSTPFIFYIPIVVGLLVYGLKTGTTSLGWVLAMVPVGWVVWCLLEYFIHRYFFHWEGIGPISRRIHEIAHGYHHKYPDDPNRLVMPLSGSIPLGLLVAGILALFNRPDITVPIFCGIVSGYLFYDYTHWATHYRQPRTAWGRAIRSHHMAHHFAVPEKNFGISHRWIDFLIGTLKKRDAGE
jgi:dihydroceramide fatty acyl 2-hydroxylase